MFNQNVVGVLLTHLEWLNDYWASLFVSLIQELFSFILLSLRFGLDTKKLSQLINSCGFVSHKKSLALLFLSPPPTSSISIDLFFVVPSFFCSTSILYTLMATEIKNFPRNKSFTYGFSVFFWYLIPPWALAVESFGNKHFSGSNILSFSLQVNKFGDFITFLWRGKWTLSIISENES